MHSDNASILAKIIAGSRARFGHGAFTMRLSLEDYIEARRTELNTARASLQTQLDERQGLVDQIADLRTVSEVPSEADARTIVDLAARAASIWAATADARADVAARAANVSQLDAELAADNEAAALSRQTRDTGVRAPGYDQVARVAREERTYTPQKSARGEASFIRDAFGARAGNMEASARLARNLQEAKVEREISERATSTSSFGGLVVPQYLVDMAARAIRSGRPVANACTHMPLPSQGMTLDVPRGTTGAAVAAQAAENTVVQNTDEVWGDLIIPVRTIAGQQDVSRQSLERGTPGIDEIVYLDLAGAYHAELDRQVINGSGASGQMLGMFQTAGISAATAYGAAITYTSFNSKVAGQIASIAGTGSGITPQLIFMHPRRWGWMSTLVDSAGRPLLVPTAQGVFNAGGVNLDPGGYGGDGNNDPTNTAGTITVGSMQGLPITTDANVPTTVGAATEDLVGIFDPNHALLWEDGDGQPRELRFDGPLANQLSVKLVIYGYAAFTAGRYSSAFGKCGGVDSTAGQGQTSPTY